MISLSHEGHSRKATNSSTRLLLLLLQLHLLLRTKLRWIDRIALPGAALSLFLREKLPAALIRVENGHELGLLFVVVLGAE